MTDIMTAIMIFIRSLAGFVALGIALHLLFPELDTLVILWAAITIDVAYTLGRRSK